VKRTSQRLYPGLLVLSILAACSKSGGGDSGPGGGSSVSPPGNFTRTVDLGTATSSNVIPFRNTAYDRAQYLYTAAQVAGSGRMTTLRFRRFATVATDTSCPSLTVRFGHTSFAALTTTFASNVETGQGSLVTVIDNSSFNVPAGAAGAWIDIPLQVPFDYNGVNNLVVDIERPAACSQNVGVNTQAAANTRMTTQTAGSTTGAVDTSRNMAQFVFAGGDAKIDFGGVGGNIFPFANPGRRTQALYLAPEINGSGLITGVAFQLNAISPSLPAGTYTYTLKLGHSTLASLTTSFAGNYSGSPVTAASEVTFTIPANIPAGEWVWVPIPDGAFVYNGTDNLIVEVVASSGTADTQLRVATTAGAGRRAFVNGDPTGTAATGTVDNSAYHLMLRFNGGPVSVITDGGTFTGLAFSPLANGRLNLYRAAELGTAGSITSVGCRMQNTSSSEASYANYQVIIGHSSVDSLVATSASDFVSQTVALNGTAFVPAGLVAGDWIELPLTTPFAYDGKSNLAIWMGTTAASGAAGTHNCLVSTSNTPRYPGQMASGVPGAATVGPQDFKFDMKLNVSR
jgi:hypothetical protein